jgi:death-on-curing protein
MPSPNSKEKYWYRYRGHQYPTIAYVEILHDAVIKEAGGLPGIKDQGLLDSAMHAPVRAVGGEDLPDFLRKSSSPGVFHCQKPSFC